MTEAEPAPLGRQSRSLWNLECETVETRKEGKDAKAEKGKSAEAQEGKEAQKAEEETRKKNGIFSGTLPLALRR